MSAPSGIRHFTSHSDYLKGKATTKGVLEDPSVTPKQGAVSEQDGPKAGPKSASDTPAVDVAGVSAKVGAKVTSEIPEVAKNAIEKISTQDSREEKSDGPGLYFMSGFRLFGLSSSDGDGIREMAKHKDNAEHFSWAQEDEVFEKILNQSEEAPLVLVGHSLGANAAVRIARKLNTAEHGFKKVDLLVTMDAFGLNNDIIPTNVKKNLNFIGHRNIFLNDGPNIARDVQSSDVINELRDELHTKIDNAPDVQSKIYREIGSVLKRAQSQIDSASNPWRFESLEALEKLEDRQVDL